MKGQEKNKENKEYRVPVSIFHATGSPEENSPPDKPQTEEDSKEKPEQKHNKRIENDFLFPLHLIF